MTAQEKINALLEALQLGPVELANAIGLRHSRIFDIYRGKVKKINIEVADAICGKFPTVNKDWLLYEQGDMIIEKAPELAETDAKGYKTIINELLSVISAQSAQLTRASQDLNRALDTINKLASRRSSSYMVAEDDHIDEL